MAVSKGRQIHGQAEQARERGEFLTALKLTDEALLVYQEENDWFGFCDVLGSRVITLLHLYEQTNREEYLVIAKHTGMSAVEIAEKTNDLANTIMPHVNLG